MIKGLFLSSTDTIDFEVPRKLLDVNHLEMDGTPVLRVRLDRPVTVFDQRPSEIVTEWVFLTNRYVGRENQIERLETFPIEVYVLVPKRPETVPTKLEELRNIAWATIHDSIESTSSR